MIKYIIHIGSIVVVLCVAIGASAKTYTISGNAPASEGKQLTVLSYKEYFTNTLEVLQTEFIDYEGNFSVTIESNPNELLVLRIDAVNAQLYMGESDSYQVVMDISKAVAPVKFTNTNWCGLEFIELPEKDLNARLEKLNRVHSEYYQRRSSDIYQVLTSPKSGVKERMKGKGVKLDVGKKEEISVVKDTDLSSVLINEFKDSLAHNGFNINNSNYESITARYMVAGLENLLGRREKELYSEYLDGAAYYRNLEFIEFKKSFYRNVFETIYQSDRKEDFLSYLYDLKLDSALIEVDSMKVLADTPLEFMLLAGIETGLNLPNVSSRDVTLLLELISREGQAPFNEMAANYRQKLAKGKMGYAPEDCSFMDLDEHMYKLSEWRGEFVYLSFFATWNTESIGHLARIKKLESKYGNRIKFVSVCMDYDWNNYKEFLIDNRNYNWLFVFGNTDKLLKEKLQISTVPHYVIIDPNGEFMFSHTPSPEEGVEATLAKLLRN